jgi:hypothetical protein
MGQQQRSSSSSGHNKLSSSSSSSSGHNKLSSGLIVTGPHY